MYGKEKKAAEAPGDLEGLFEAAGVPDKLTNGQLPFSPEWYAGAKERQRLRDIEKEELLAQRAGVRTEWAELVWTDLGTWRDRIDFTVSMPEPLADLQVLLARTKHERPEDVERYEELLEVAAKAEARQVQVRQELSATRSSIVDIEAEIRRKEEQDDAEEKDRIEKKRLADKRRRRAERVLKRNEALLRGEEPPPLVEDSEAEGMENPDSPTSAPSPSNNLEESVNGSKDILGSRTPKETQTAGTPIDSSSAALASPTLQRGGMARELPPLQDPPQPPLT